MSRFNRDVMFSTGWDEWETPEEVFDYFNDRFHFTLDVCATHENTKCERYFTKEQNGLKENWGGEICWMNPPYSENKKWVRKAYLVSLKPGTIVVCLLPSRTGTTWFNDYCSKGDVWFIKGRLRFRGARSSAPFDSMIVIFPRDWKEVLSGNKRGLSVLERNSPRGLFPNGA